MTVRLPDLGESFLVQPIVEGNAQPIRAAARTLPGSTRSLPAGRRGTGGALVTSRARWARRVGGVSRAAFGQRFTHDRATRATDLPGGTRCGGERPRRGFHAARLRSSVPASRRRRFLPGASHGSGRRLSLRGDGPEGGAAGGTARLRHHGLPWAIGGDIPGWDRPHARPTGTTSHRSRGTST